MSAAPMGNVIILPVIYIERHEEDYPPMSSQEIERRKQRIKEAQEQAIKEGKAVTFVDLDGCEVTVRPDGVYFYNMADWY